MTLRVVFLISGGREAYTTKQVLQLLWQYGERPDIEAVVVTEESVVVMVVSVPWVDGTTGCCGISGFVDEAGDGESVDSKASSTNIPSHGLRIDERSP